MKALVVIAHPCSDSFSHVAAGRAVDGLREAGHDVDTIDLYDPIASPAQRLYETTFRALDWHEIRVISTGTMNPSASDVLVRSDGFEFTF